MYPVVCFLLVPLPFCNGTVSMVPNRIFPVVGIFVFLNDQFFVYFHAETGQFGQRHKAIGECEVFLIFDIIQNAFSYISKTASILS